MRFTAESDLKAFVSKLKNYYREELSTRVLYETTGRSRIAPARHAEVSIVGLAFQTGGAATAA